LKLFYWKKIFRSDLRDDQTSSNLLSEKHYVSQPGQQEILI